MFAATTRKTTEGDLNLDDMAVDIAASRGNFAAVLEQLAGGVMPPEDEPQPKPEETARVIGVGFDRDLPRCPAPQDSATEKRAGAHEGNHVPHSLLFGGKPGPSVPPPARLWRLSPQGYAAGSASLREGRRATDFLSRLRFAKTRD